MKIIKNWETFNELKQSTYKSAADKYYDEYGASKKSMMILKHAEDMLLRRFSDVEPFIIKNIETDKNYESRFLGIHVEQKDDDICFYVSFKNTLEPIKPSIKDKAKEILKMDDKKDGGDTSYVANIFKITYNIKTKKIVVAKKSRYAYFSISDFANQGTPLYKFNKKDATRILNIIKAGEVLIDDYDFEGVDFNEIYDDMVSKLSVKHFISFE